MSNNAHPIDALIAQLAPVRDESLAGAVRSSTAADLLTSILASPVSGRRPDGRRWSRVVAFAAAIAAAALLSIPAFGVGHEIVSLFAGWRDPEAPVPSASDVLIASGEAGAPWKIVATTSDQGLCLGLFYRVGDDSIGSAGCGYRDIRGDLPADVRGDPGSRCIATPTTLVPCGSLPRHWIDLGGGGSSAGFDRTFAFGPLAQEVARVDIVLADGRTLRAQVMEQPEGLPLNFYWAAWEGGPVVKLAIARDAAGRVLERRVPAWNGNPTGDPEGPSPPVPLGE